MRPFIIFALITPPAWSCFDETRGGCFTAGFVAPSPRPLQQLERQVRERRRDLLRSWGLQHQGRQRVSRLDRWEFQFQEGPLQLRMRPRRRPRQQGRGARSRTRTPRPPGLGARDLAPRGRPRRTPPSPAVAPARVTARGMDADSPSLLSTLSTPVTTKYKHASSTTGPSPGTRSTAPGSCPACC